MRRSRPRFCVLPAPSAATPASLFAHIVMLMAALAATLGPVASAQGAQADPIPARPTWISPSAMEAAEYATSFDVSTQEAVDNLALQRSGAEAPELLEEGLGENYAGVWFDNDRGEFVVPTATDRVPPLLAKDLREGGVSDFHFQPARFSWEQLEAAQRELNSLLGPLFSESLVLTAISPEANRVVVRLSEAATARQRALLKQAVTQAGAERVETEEAPPSALRASPLLCGAAKVCGPPLRGGVAIGPKESAIAFRPTCTAGFKAIGNVYGNRFLLTAGHCTDSEAQWWTEDYEHEAKLEPIGTLEEKVYPGGDWAKYKANGTPWDVEPWPNEIAVWGENQDYAINYERGSYSGLYLCHSGLTTGTSCGTVGFQNLTVELNNFESEESGVVENHLAEFGKVCAQNGDSGGPIFAEHTAYGLVSAGTLSLPECKRTIYYPEITEATAEMGVHVGERRGAPPVAETLGAHFSPEHFHEGSFDGEVAPHNLETTYYFQYGPTTAYGSTTEKKKTGPGNFYYVVNTGVRPLNGKTTYHYRLVASNGAGTSYGEDKTTTTPAWGPVVTSSEALPLEATKEEMFTGSVDPAERQTSAWAEYRSATETQKSGSTTIEAGEPPRGYLFSSGRPLAGNTHYEFRIVAQNSEATSYGAWVPFTTPPW